MTIPIRRGHARAALAFQRDPILALRRLRARHGPTVAFARGTRGAHPRLYVVTSDPELARRVLGDRAFRGSGLALSGPRGSAQRRIRQGLFRLHGDEHDRVRRLLAPALGRAGIESRAATMRSIVETHFASWRPGDRRDLAGETRQLALALAARTLFPDADPAAVAGLAAGQADWLRRNGAVLTRLLPFDLPGTPYRRLLARAEELERGVRQIVDARAAAAREGDDLLSRLLRTGEVAGAGDGAALAGHLNVLLLAAHETTAHALAWTLFLLAQHPGVSERLARELGPSAPTGASGAPFLDAVVRESLRLFSVVPYILRVATEPLRIDGCEMGAGSRVVVCVDVMHTLEQHFPSPLRFAPERWLDATFRPRAYLPFGAGDHVCPGRSFALDSLALVIAHAIRRLRWRLRPLARIDRRVGIVLAPRRGLPIEVLEPDAPFERVAVRGDVHDLVDLGEAS